MSGHSAPDPLAGMPDPQAWVAERLAALPQAPDPVAQRSITALARRAATQQGEARRLMLARLDQWLAKASAAGVQPPAVVAKASQPPTGNATLAGLAELVDRLGRSSSASGPASAGSAAPGSPHPAAASRADARTHPAAPGVRPGAAAQAGARAALSPDQQQPPAPQPPGLKSVTAFKSTWARLRTEQRLRQALDQVPAQAGPLNSSQLVQRALHTLQALSPAYLNAFMAQVDTLLWLDQASGGGLPDPKPRPGAAAVRSPPPARPATRRRPARKPSRPG